MKIIGLTGGIGSGKTTIAKMFEDLGIPVYYADNEAKILMNNSKKIKKKLINLYGENAFQKNILNREYIANIVFNNRDKLMELNAIVHPEVENHFNKWLENNRAPYVIQENALIYENDRQRSFDDIITVTAPIDMRISRIKARDNTSEDRILERIGNQLDDDIKIKRSKYVIYNTDLQQSKIQVADIHEDLMH